jgi:FixJ family two-component response regulator
LTMISRCAGHSVDWSRQRGVLRRDVRVGPRVSRLIPSDRTACLVLDIHLNGMSAFDLEERLMAERVAIPIIFITAHDDAATRERIRGSGAAGYLAKPFDGQVLLDVIGKVVGSA